MLQVYLPAACGHQGQRGAQQLAPAIPSAGHKWDGAPQRGRDMARSTCTLFSWHCLHSHVSWQKHTNPQKAVTGTKAKGQETRRGAPPQPLLAVSSHTLSWLLALPASYQSPNLSAEGIWLPIYPQCPFVV